MQYTRPQNIWNMSIDQMRQMQPGQWVFAGHKGDKGQFLGVKKSNSVVVAWHGNAKRQRGYIQYIRSLRQFAKNG